MLHSSHRVVCVVVAVVRQLANDLTSYKTKHRIPIESWICDVVVTCHLSTALFFSAIVATTTTTLGTTWSLFQSNLYFIYTYIHINDTYVKTKSRKTCRRMKKRSKPWFRRNFIWSREVMMCKHRPMSLTSTRFVLCCVCVLMWVWSGVIDWLMDWWIDWLPSEQVKVKYVILLIVFSFFR